MAGSTAVDKLLQAASSLPPGRVLVAVSGGADSVALLRASRELGRDLAVGHVNHSLRGEESDADEAFVRSLTERLGVPLLVARVDTRAAAAGARESLEAAARRLRYAALRAMLSEQGCAFLATAHTRDDQAETLLLHLLRGAGTSGLAAMDPGGAVARPFLSVSRATVREALRIWRQDYRDDSSNTAPRFTRNRLRRDVMPLLEHFNPRVAERLAHTAEILRRDANFIEMETNRVLASLRVSTRAGAVSASRAGWGALHLALAATVARRLIEMVLGDVQDVEERHVASLIQAVQVGRPARLELPRGLRVEIAPRIVTLSVGLTDRESIPLRPTPLGVPGTLELETGTLTARELFQTDAADIARFIVVAGPNHALLDADAAGADLAIRSRSPGDRVKPAGTEVTRKLQDILVDARVPRARRDSIPVVTNGKHILWVPGLAVDRRASATPSSTRILHLVWTPNSARIP